MRGEMKRGGGLRGLARVMGKDTVGPEGKSLASGR